MAQTVSNESLNVVHMGSAHTAKSSDPCKNGTFDNCAYSANLAAGRATKTKITDQFIGMEMTHWVPSVSGGVIGDKSGTTCMEAYVTTGSKDLFIENMPAARSSDPTKNNHGNSSGTVSDGTLEPSAESLEERAKKKCQLASWKGVGADGAILGYKGKDKTGDPNYLEIYDTDVVTFTAYRKDITQTPPAINQKCEAPTKGGELHTIWDAKGKVFPLYLREGHKHEHSKDTFEVPADLVLEPWTAGDVVQMMQEGDMAGAAAAIMGKSLSKFATSDGDARGGEAGEGMGAQDYGIEGGNLTGSGAGSYINPVGKDGINHTVSPGRYSKKSQSHEWIDQTKPRTGDDATRAPKGQQNPDWFEGDPRTLLFYAWWFTMPPEIKVSASSCSGGRSATLKVLPNQKVKFKLNLGKIAKSAAGKANDRARKKDREAREAEKAKDAIEKQKEALQQQADQAKQAADQAKKAQGQALGQLATAMEKGKSIGGNTGAAKKGRARQQKKADKAYDKWKKAGDEAFKQMAQYRVAMAKFETMEAHFNKAVSALNTMKKAATTAQKIATVAKQPLKLKFLEGFKLGCKISYERTSDRMSAQKWRYYTTATMGQKWEFSLFIEPVIMIDYTVYFSLLNFVAPYLATVAHYLRKYRIFRVDLFFSIALSISVDVTIEKDEHDEFSGGGATRANVIPSIGAIAGGASVDIVKFTARLPTDIRATYRRPFTKGALATLTPQFRITNYYNCTLFPDRWWEIEAFSGRIPGLRYFFNSNGKVKYELGSLPA